MARESSEFILCQEDPYNALLHNL